MLCLQCIMRMLQRETHVLLPAGHRALSACEAPIQADTHACRWLFLIEGLITIIFGIIFYVGLSPTCTVLLQAILDRTGSANLGRNTQQHCLIL